MLVRNNIFPQLKDKIYKRYRKTVIYQLGGKRLDPFNIDKNSRLDWVLKTEEVNFDFQNKVANGFTYADEVIELYSEVEDQVFKRENAVLFTRGLIVEYKEDQPAIIDNTQHDIDAIAKTKNIHAFRKQISTLPAAVLSQLENKLREYNRPVSFFDALKKI